MKKRKLGKVFLAGFFLIIIGFSGWKLWSAWAEYAKGTETYDAFAGQYTVKVTEKVSGGAKTNGSGAAESGNAETDEAEQQEEMISVDFGALKEQYPDAVAWIYCPGTPVNYPVAQSGDNEYYLNRLADGTHNKNGTLFMDFRNAGDFSDRNTIIYGHNMKNGSMFGAVPDYRQKDFYEEHPVWYLFTGEGDYRIELAGGYVTPADSDTYSFPQTEEETATLWRKAVSASSFRADTEFLEGDRLVTLSTCVYDYENARYVLVGVLREIDREENPKTSEAGGEQYGTSGN